jgi:predicted nucleotide-binding protein
MASLSNQNMLRRFEKRINSVRNADFNSLQQSLSSFWSFFNNEPILQQIRENLINQFPNISEKVFQVLQTNSSIKDISKSELESVAIACEVLYEVTQVESGNFRGTIQRSVSPNEFSIPVYLTQTNIDEKSAKLFKDWYLDKFSHYVEEQLEDAQSQQITTVPTQNMENQADPRKVFVVHGRNEALRRSMFDFLRAIGLEPIEWTEAIRLTGKAAPYVGEILDTAFSVAQAIVVLMTPDDEARLLEVYRGEKEPIYETELTGQPRQNVLIEAGLALGRHPDRTVLIEVGELRPISDIIGRHTIRLNNSIGKRQDIVDRLETARCDVNIKGKRDWHEVGNFELANTSKTPIKKFPPLRSLNDYPKPELIKAEIEILDMLSQVEDSDYHNLQEKLQNLKPAYLKHYLNNLEVLSYIDKTQYDDGNIYYRIKPDGLAYLVKNNL